jgi:D-glycero-D-manno-heptose 1,7-bisphosphate phosphatase
LTRKAAFLDRDGVVNVDHGYVHRIEDFHFQDGIFQACRHLAAQGFLLIVVTNQSGIARGYYSGEDFDRLTAWMTGAFADNGVKISAVYHCPHHPDFGPPADRDCDCRKPRPGMIDRAVAEFGLDRAASLMIGDSMSDMQAAKAARLGLRILLAPNGAEPAAAGAADQVWSSLAEARERL